MTRTRRHFLRAFTLIEICVVVLIIAILLAILVPGLNWAKRNAETAATQQLLHSIATGIEDYYETAEFVHTLPSSTPSAFKGPVTLNRGSVMLAEALTGFLPYGADGAGYDANNSWKPHAYTEPNSTKVFSDPVYGFRLHIDGHGKVYGPYVRVDDPLSFRLVPGTNTVNNAVYLEQVFIDRWQNEILYYKAVPPVIKGIAGAHDTPRNIKYVFSTWPASNNPADFDGIFVIADNSATKDKFGNTISDPSTSTSNAFWKTLGCSAPNTINPGDVVVGADNYLLLSAGRDGIFFTDDDIVQVTK